jgi:hypothetical protein
MTTCNYCGGYVTRERRTGPYAINSEDATEYRFGCQSCDEVATLLLMDGVGWEPCSMLDLDHSEAAGVAEAK